MSKSATRAVIRLRGVRHNNLKNFDLDLPLNQLIVVTGLSGSGKSSLAFDTLFAEGQRRYIETFSPYARQFFDRMDKPQVDSIEGIPPAIAIEQRNSVKTTRSTVGTMTEICDYMKVLWPYVAQLHCRRCGQPVHKDNPQAIWQTVRKAEGEQEQEWLVTFDLPLSERLSLKESLALVARQGYQRVLLQDQARRLDEALAAPGAHAKRLSCLTVIQDRVRLTPAYRARFSEACEQAYHFGKGELALRLVASSKPTRVAPLLKFSNRLHCAQCNIEYHEPSTALFSFNHPVGACPTCRGFGRIISIDYGRAVPEHSRTLAQGVVKPWLTGHGLECQDDLLRVCRRLGIPTDVPFRELPEKWQRFVIEGEPDYGKDALHEWPRAWYGVKGYFRWLESRSYKMHVRVLLSRYRAYTPCPDCHGTRFRPEALLYRVAGRVEDREPGVGTRSLNGTDLGLEPARSSGFQGRPESLDLAGFYRLPVRDALVFVKSLQVSEPSAAIKLVLSEVVSRLQYLEQVGLGYLTLDRPTRSLSGGETERVNLTTCLGTRLVNTLFVLDEPSVGLHARDTERLVKILLQLRDAGNTVLVVEHEPAVMRAADQILDLGPGHGATGGNIVFQGSYAEVLEAPNCLTGEYLSGKKQIPEPNRRPTRVRRLPRESGRRSKVLMLRDCATPSGPEAESPVLQLSHATRHNLKDLSVSIPLQRFVCVTGVSGSGKSTLVREVLLPALTATLRNETLARPGKASDLVAQDRNGEDQEALEASETENTMLHGVENLDCVVFVDQSLLGKTPRSNPAVYIGAFDEIRELFAQTELAIQRGLKASAFSFNSNQGQCERCRGAGFEKIEMQFLSDVFIRCPDCDGRRYRPHILEIKLAPLKAADAGAAIDAKRQRNHGGGRGNCGWSIADVLDATVEETIEFLSGICGARAQRAVEKLQLLNEVGLGYLRLGQPINTLSGGESQRLKLVRHLADVTASGSTERILFLFDEPTTGLHFDDVRVLLSVFQRLVDAGHSVVVIEHNLDVIKSADWVIDLGPEAGDQGGEIVIEGTPEDVAACPRSHTGRALVEVFNSKPGRTRTAVLKERG